MNLHVFRLDDKQFKNICTHSHINTQGSRTSGVLELYLNTPGLNGEEFSRHGERHIEYTVYVQTKQKKTFQHEQLYYRIKNNDQKTVNLHFMEKENKTHTNTNTKYFLAQYNAVP